MNTNMYEAVNFSDCLGLQIDDVGFKIILYVQPSNPNGIFSESILK